MKTRLTIRAAALLLVLSIGRCAAQVATDACWREGVKSVQLYCEGAEYQLPTLALEGRGRMVLEFDVLGAEPESFAWRIRHCSREWEVDAMQPVEFIRGLAEGTIDDYDFSFTTRVDYVHYRAEVPGPWAEFTHSGNYLLEVYSLDEGAEHTLLTRRFCVSEQAIGLKVEVVQPYDGDLNMVDAAGFSNKARGKSLAQLAHGKDSLELHYDSLGMDLGREFNQRFYQPPIFSREDSLRAVEQALNSVVRLDTIYDKMEVAEKSKAVNRALQKVQSEISELSFRSMLSKDGDRQIREHQMEMINKFTLALSCIIFFFVGAPLGAITRKGGIGIPVIIAVVVYIFYVILNQTGYRMARGGMWTVPFGKALAPAVLTPLAVFVTYKANNDSGVFNLDLYKDLFRRALGLRIHRYVPSKEVVMERPDYPNLSARLANISDEVTQYAAAHNLKKAPNVKKVFFQYEPDHEIERIVGELESAIEELSNSRDKVIIHQLNDYPIVSEKAHTRPFERKWMNIMAAIIVPAGLFFYLRMWMFRLRLWGDLKKIKQTNSNIIERIAALPFSTAKA